MSRDASPSDGVQQEIVVEFTQRFTVKPPESIDDPVHAEDWFWNIYSDIGWDAVDVRRKKHYDVIDVRQADSVEDAATSDKVDRCPECGSGSIRVTEDETQVVACFGCDTVFESDTIEPHPELKEADTAGESARGGNDV